MAIQVGSDDTDKTIKDIIKGYYEILLISPESLLTIAKTGGIFCSHPVYKEQLVGVVEMKHIA